MCEVLALQYEDCRIIEDSGNRFFEGHIRSSKTDPFCRRKETLTLPLSVKHAVPIAEKMEELCQKQRKGKSSIDMQKRLKIFRPNLREDGQENAARLGIPEPRHGQSSSRKRSIK